MWNGEERRINPTRMSQSDYKELERNLGNEAHDPNNLQGLVDEYESCVIVYNALRIAYEAESSEFVRAALTRSMKETLSALVKSSLDLADALGAEMCKVA